MAGDNHGGAVVGRVGMPRPGAPTAFPGNCYNDVRLPRRAVKPLK
ncbi:MAG: hypothetical protein KatS3mg111_3907 [Pirellulaceae bacterium]|nr:MAG: hypothetical protein KatS3mg111_3907 [Pirellulaceae bacterium]